jgi:hypothetical protein
LSQQFAVDFDLPYKWGGEGGKSIPRIARESKAQHPGENFHLKEFLNLRYLIDFLVYFAGKSFMNTNNFAKFLKIQIISGLAYWDQEKLVDEKPEIKIM